MNKSVMIVAGEASGDLHGSGLVRELMQKEPELEVFGVGGDKMKQQGARLLYHINEMSVLGIVDVIKRFRFFRRVYHDLVSALKEKRPGILILIDYPGMNLKLAKAAQKIGIEVFYYIAPQVWAWGANRIQKMVKLVNRMAVIIPFEEKMFSDAGIDARFVGHPLLEVLKTRMSRSEFINANHLENKKKIIGLLPGSRQLEVKRLLPEMSCTVDTLIKKHDDIQVVVSRASSVSKQLYEDILNANCNIKILEDQTYEIMKYSDLLIVASGTATLESALFKTPLIIVYKVDPISYQIGKRLVRIENIGLVNVIAEKTIVPEFIQNHFNCKELVPAAETLLYNTEIREEIISDLTRIRNKLGESGASARTAELILEMIDSKNDDS
ncbi:lipid-A-disaccharide synthase [candidate division KSB1 bacterium]|nr:lipid-A-disaccharide synthase [candidate division KSB1 bacterium]